MKVLHLISGGDTGGAKTHLISLVKGLDKIIDAKVVCFIKDTFYEDVKKAGIDIEVYQQKKRYDMSVINRLAKLIEEEKYDIIHCHGARANFIAMFLKGKISRPLITTIHSDYKLDFKDNFYKRLVFTTLNTLALKKMDYYIAISHTFKGMLESRGFKGEDIFVAYNGIDLEEKIHYVTREEFLDRYGIEAGDKKIVGIVGRLDGVKDHDTFIKAAKYLSEKREDLIFLIAGSGHEENRLRLLAKELGLDKKLYFLGFVKDPYSFFNAIDVNTLTSISESFPYVILEGARMKKPVVSTRVGGLDNLIVDGRNGYLVDVHDYRDLGDKISLLLETREGLREKGENLLRDVENKFSSNSMAKAHVKIYEEIYKKVEENRK